jgi:hypothetical protein
VTQRIGTSVAAPGIVNGRPWGHDYVVAFAAGGGYGGAEPNKRINLIRSGLLGNPTVLDEWSDDSIALATTSVALPHQWYLEVAWTGNDPLRRLNTATSLDAASLVNKRVHDDTALGGPALCNHDGDLAMAWTGGGGLGGGPPDRRITVTHGGGRVILPDRSTTAPALASGHLEWSSGDLGSPRLYLAWTDLEGAIFFSWATGDDLEGLADPSHVSRVETAGRIERTAEGPGLGFDGNALFISWAGVDDAHRINFKVIEGFQLGRKVILGESSTSAVVLQPFALDSATSEWTGRYAYRGTDGVGGVYVSERAVLV